VALALILNITWAADIKCDVTTTTDNVAATAEQTCDAGVLYCHTETNENGDKTYGCGLCPNGDGTACEQCVGNDAMPCNRVGTTVGPKCNVTIGDVGTAVNCDSSVTKCYSPSDIYNIDKTGTKFTEYGCGDCPESANADACVQCDGTTDTACNAGSNSPTIDPDGYCFEQNRRPIGDIVARVAYTGRQDCINLCLSFDSCKSITITPAWWRFRECFVIGDPYKVHDSPPGWIYAPRSCFAPIVCEVTNSVKGPVPMKCDPGTRHCHSNIDGNGVKVWGCGLCPNRPLPGGDCTQCVGNDATPCNKEGVPGGVICDMTIGKIYGHHVTTPVTCGNGITECYDQRVMNTPIYMEYGCGGCIGRKHCEQCRGNKETACNSETKCNPLNNDDYRQFSHGNVMMLNTLLLPLLLALWV